VTESTESIRAVPVLRSREVTIIDGYLPSVDRRPRGLRLGEDCRRVGLIINQYYPELPGEFFFDHELALAIARVVGSLGDRVTATFLPGAISGVGRSVVQRLVPTWNPRRELVLEDIETLSRIYRAIWEAEDRDDPSESTSFDELLVMAGSTTVAEVRTLDYHQFGGPEPYHDQLLWSVYLPSTNASRFIAQLGDVATAMGVKLTQMQGVEALKENLWTRAVDFVTRR
jgi:hypothetical protein